MKNFFNPSIDRNVSVKTRFRYCLNLNFIPIFAVALLIISTLTSTTATANQGIRYNQEVQNAKDSITKSLNSAGFKSFTAEAYCNDASCRAQIQNPKESGYLNDANKMVNDGTIALANDPNAINLVEGYKERPKYDIDPNDPALQRAKGYMDDSYNISHGISSKYHDCEGGNVCKFVDTTRQCNEPTNTPITCNTDLVVSSEHLKPRTQRLNYSYMSALAGGLQLPLVSNNLKVDSIRLNGASFRLNTRSERIGIAINGKILKTVLLYPKNSVYTLSNIDIDVNQTLPKSNLVHLHRMNTGGQKLDFNVYNNVYVIVRWKEKQLTTEWRSQCPTLPTECRNTKTVCTEGAGWRTINGVEIYRNCWKQSLTYTCNYADTCTPLLTPTNDNPDSLLTCALAQPEQRSCKVSILGQCLVYDVGLVCEEQKCESRNLVCGETSFCLDGDCYEGEGEENENAAESLAGLAALGAVAEDFSEDNVMIFTGKGAQCDKKPMGLSDCCSDDGWGNDIGLTDCSAEEKGLLQAKQDGLTIGLGEYCAEKVLGVCIRKKKSYCQFDSKMARIIQEQGKVQLGIGFGTKKDPICTGITTEQMQKLDFSIIDFSDFYEDMESNMNLPDMDLIQDSIKDKFTDM